MRGQDRASEGLRPLWRVEPDLERDRDSRQHATQHNDPEHASTLGLRPGELAGRVQGELAGRSDQRHRRF